MFTLILGRKKPGKTREETGEETREEIIKIITENPKVTMREITAKIGMSPKGVEYHIRKIREEYILRRVRSTKSVH